MHPHNSVNVTGGTQIQRQLAYDLVEHCVDQMLPRHRTLWIEVELKKIPDKDKVVGYCQDDGDNMFTIEIDKTQIESDIFLKEGLIVTIIVNADDSNILSVEMPQNVVPIFGQH